MPTILPQSIGIATGARNPEPWTTALTEHPEPTRLMIVVQAGESALDRLNAALAVTDIASVIIAPAVGMTLDAAAVAPLIAAAQKAGAAALLQGDARLARTMKADGVHLPVSETAEAAYGEAREILGNRFVIGVDVGRSKHDAMTLGESGAEYVGFGVPAFVKDREVARERQLDLVAWWAEIFQIPCVAFDIETPEDAEAMALAGADFVCTTLSGGASPADTSARVKAFAAAIAVMHSARD